MRCLKLKSDGVACREIEVMRGRLLGFLSLHVKHSFCPGCCKWIYMANFCIVRLLIGPILKSSFPRQPLHRLTTHDTAKCCFVHIFLSIAEWQQYVSFFLISWHSKSRYDAVKQGNILLCYYKVRYSNT